MLCSHCTKKEAEVFFKQIVNNQVTQMALCHDCAKKTTLAPAAANQLLLNILSGIGAVVGQAPARGGAAALRCPVCGLRYAQFQATGLLGCAQCYEAFKVPLAGLLKRIHGAQRHSGKTLGKPEAAAEERLRLAEALKAAIAAENFEDAAALRDRLRELEST